MTTASSRDPGSLSISGSLSLSLSLARFPLAHPLALLVPFIRVLPIREGNDTKDLVVRNGRR